MVSGMVFDYLIFFSPLLAKLSLMLDEVKVPEVVLKLTTKGVYIWSISLPFTSDTEVLQRLKDLDNKLKDSFPSHAKIGTGRIASFDEFRED